MYPNKMPLNRNTSAGSYGIMKRRNYDYGARKIFILGETNNWCNKNPELPYKSHRRL